MSCREDVSFRNQTASTVEAPVEALKQSHPWKFEHFGYFTVGDPCFGLLATFSHVQQVASLLGQWCKLVHDLYARSAAHFVSLEKKIRFDRIGSIDFE